MHYPVELPLRIDWSELDLFGHVNNVAFMKYVQASRVNYWDTIGLTRLYNDTRQGPMLASTACRFKKPLYYPGSIVVKARVDFIKTTSFGIHHIIVDHLGDVAAEAEDVIVMYDFNAGSKMQFPVDLRRKVEELEGKTF